MQHGWFIIQCMAYVRKRSREFTPRSEPWLVDLIMSLRRHDDATKDIPVMHLDSEETQVVEGANSCASATARAPTRRRSVFRRVSETSSVGQQDEHAAPERLALCDKPAEEVHQGKVFLYNRLGDYATMIHKGEHIASKVYTTNKENHRIYVWPCGTIWTCKEGWLDVDQEEDETDGNADYQGEEEQADDGEEEEGGG